VRPKSNGRRVKRHGRLSKNAAPVSRNRTAPGLVNTARHTGCVRKAGENMSRCKYCGTDILFIKNRNGKFVPCETELVNYWEHRFGGCFVMTISGEKVYCTIRMPHPVIEERCRWSGTPLPKPDGFGYAIHVCERRKRYDRYTG